MNHDGTTNTTSVMFKRSWAVVIVVVSNGQG
jgi:hypothetical protein